MFSFTKSLLAVGFVYLIGLAAAPAVTLTVTPPVTSNTYAGVITLDITGLTNGEKVTIQRYLDLNADASIDTSEPLVDVFKITDGQATMIAGVTNINAPFDNNPTAGTITTALTIPSVVVLENITAQSIYRVVSPTGRFTPVTATFLMTNASLSQSVSGIVYTNGVAAPNVVVVAQDMLANNPAAAAVTDNTGHYFLTLNPATYALLPTAPNFYFDQALASPIALTNGMSATNDLSLTNGTVTLSGSIYDATNSNALGGILVQLQSGSLFAVAFTDTNGNYSAAVTPSFWKVKPTKERLSRRGYVMPQATFQVDTTAGPVTNANVGLPRGTALYYGRITDNLGAPFASIEFSADDLGNNYSAKGYSDANGYYAVAILGETNDMWACETTSAKNVALSAYIVNQFNSLTVVSNQTVLEDYVALPTTARISGRVQDNAGTSVVNVSVDATAIINNKSYATSESITDTNGTYSLAAASGDWNVFFPTGGSQLNLETHGYVDLTAPHMVTIPPTNIVLNLTVYPFGTPLISQPQRLSSTQFGFNVTGATNVNYTVQVSSDLGSTNWLPLLSFSLTNNPFPITDSQATNALRFYRVQKN